MMNARARLISLVFCLVCVIVLQACSKVRSPEDIIKDAVFQAASICWYKK